MHIYVHTKYNFEGGLFFFGFLFFLELTFRNTLVNQPVSLGHTGIHTNMETFWLWLSQKHRIAHDAFVLLLVGKPLGFNCCGSGCH